MNNGSCTVDIHEGIEKLDPNISQPDSWADNSNQNILDSQGMYTGWFFNVMKLPLLPLQYPNYTSLYRKEYQTIFVLLIDRNVSTN